jgi:hypothetical protein
MGDGYSAETQLHCRCYSQCFCSRTEAPHSCVAVARLYGSQKRPLTQCWFASRFALKSEILLGGATVMQVLGFDTGRQSQHLPLAVEH